MKRNTTKKTSGGSLEFFQPDYETDCELPLFMARVAAGFPSPADDYIEGRLDLNKHLIKHPAATYFVKAIGDSMIDAGIHSGDIMIVDRSLEATDKKVVIAVLHGEFTVKRIKKIDGKLFLVPENEKFNPIELNEDSDCELWGIVTNVIHPL